MPTHADGTSFIFSREFALFPFGIGSLFSIDKITFSEGKFEALALSSKGLVITAPAWLMSELKTSIGVDSEEYFIHD